MVNGFYASGENPENTKLSPGSMANPALLWRNSTTKNFQLQDTVELLFEYIKPLPDVFHIPATRENDFS